MPIVVTTADVLSSDGKHPDRAKVAPASVIAAAGDFAAKVTPVLQAFGQRRSINSGYRTPEANVAAGGAKNSSHLYGMACDFEDADRDFTDWCLKNLDVLATNGLWMESPDATKTWVHLQSRPVLGARVFNP